MWLGCGPSPRVQRTSRALNGIASDFNGSAVRPGSMYPPTHTHRDALDEALATLDEAETLIGG